jgi:hypothetical protein
MGREEGAAGLPVFISIMPALPAGRSILLLGMAASFFSWGKGSEPRITHKCAFVKAKAGFINF